MRVTIEKLSYGGDGVARIEPVTFVPRAAAADALEVDVTEKKPRFQRARILKVLEAGPTRQAPPCPHYQGADEAHSCGGCQYQHIRYDAQVAAKTEQLVEALRRIGGFASARVNAPLAAEKALGYRNKATFRWNPEGGSFALIAADGKSLVDIPSCPLTNAPVKRVYEAANAVAKKLAAEDPAARAGMLSLVVRGAEGTGETLVALIAKKGFPRALAETFSKRLRETTQVTAAVFAENPRPGEPLFDATFDLLAGSRTIREKLLGLTFFLDAETFFQVNSEQAARLYQRTVECARLGGGETVLDLFCGNGGISLAVARHAKKVIGVDVVRRSIERGVESAQENGFENVRFIRQDAEDALKKLVHAERLKADVVILDPPRAGVKPSFVKKMLQLEPKRIVYVSCNPTTLARDLKAIAAAGYELREVTPVDLFPQTFHLESVAMLEKK